MEYILINESKLKVTLEGGELEERALEAKELDYSLPRAKQLFCDILDHAKDEFGFDTSGYRILLQLYPSNDGGCELFVTRLGKLAGEQRPESAQEPKAAKSASADGKKPPRKSERAFSFERLSHLIDVCRRLSSLSLDCESSVYTDAEGKWYLLLEFADDGIAELFGVLPLSEISFISEYGYAEDLRPLSLYLGEYASEVCLRNAVQTFSGM